jgi:hypothetical protein
VHRAGQQRCRWPRGKYSPRSKGVWQRQVEKADGVQNLEISDPERQVLLSFTITANAAIGLAWATFLLGPYDAESMSTMNTLDEHILRWISFRKGQKGFLTLPEHWKPVIRQMILMFSDTHLVTGAAILIAGFAQACRLTIYHYVTVVYLGWLCSATHMATLTILRPYFRAEDNRQVLYWRLFAMTIVFGLLFAGLSLTGSSHWPVIHFSDFYEKGLTPVKMFYFDSPIACSWENGYLRAWPLDTILSICILTLGFISRLTRLFESSSQLCQRKLVDRPGHYLKEKISSCHSKLYCANQTRRPLSLGHRLLLHVMRITVVVIYVTARCVHDLYTAIFSELLWLTISMLWGLSKIFSYRNFSPIAAYENSWSFGQLLPMLLLALPLISIPELLADTKKPHEVADQADPADAPEQVSSAVALRPIKPASRVTTVNLESNASDVPLQNHPFLIRSPDHIYRYVGFYFLLVPWGGYVFGVFAYIVCQQWMGNLSAARSLLSPYEPVMMLGGIVYPLAWVLIIAPFSRLLRTDFNDPGD